MPHKLEMNTKESMTLTSGINEQKSHDVLYKIHFLIVAVASLMRPQSHRGPNCRDCLLFFHQKFLSLCLYKMSTA